jgi:hypothetical protein
MNETKHVRKGKRIRHLTSGEVEVFKSINLAKKESWKLQANGKELGYGTVRRE